MPRVNILKQVKVEDRWKLVSIPRDEDGRLDWKSLPDGRYFVEWWEAGKRKREAGGATVADAQEVARRRKHKLEARALGLAQDPAQEVARTPLHVAVKRYLDVVEGLKKPNTLRKYRAVLNRFLDFFSDRATIKSITPDDLNAYMVHLKRKHNLGSNSVIHNMIIVAQFLKRQGRGGTTRAIDLPQSVTTLPIEYTDDELKKFFDACTGEERAIFTTFLLTGMRDKEVVHLAWIDINFALTTIKVTSKPDLGFYPKRWEEREIPVARPLLQLLEKHPRRSGCRFVFPSPAGNREYHLLDRCKAVAKRAKLNEEKFNLKTFRSTYATRMLRAGFDVRTVQHWMGHKSLETTMRYLAPARDIQEKLNRIQIAGILPILEL